MNVGLNGWELIILIVLAVLILGPEKLPEYARKLTEWIRTLRHMAEGAKEQFKDETGTDFDEIDWRRYDPRQYDPRRIIQEALAEPIADVRDTAREAWSPQDHDAVRGEFTEMDPRALVRGKAGRTDRTGTSRASGSGSTAADPAEREGRSVDGAGLGAAAAGVASASGSRSQDDEQAQAPAESPERPAPPRPVPFDSEAT